jgi:ABC-type sugar transport system substrate-binding protein
MTILAALLLAACGGRPATHDATKKPKIGVVLMQQDQFFRLNEAGMRAAADEAGVDLRVQSAAGALDKEVAIVETFTAQRVDAVVVSPLSREGSVPALRRAHEAGIHIVTYNNTLAGNIAAYSIASDQRSLGAASGRAARAFIETKLHGNARVALIGFASQLPEQGGARQEGFKSELRSLPGVTIVAEQDAWEAAQATTAVSELLAKRPDVVWAANEGGTVGAVVAIRNAGAAGKIAVFGTDLSAQLLDFLEAQDGILQAVTAQAPVEMGGKAVEAAVALVTGRAIPPSDTLPGKLYAREDKDGLAAARAALATAAP